MTGPPDGLHICPWKVIGRVPVGHIWPQYMSYLTDVVP